MGRMFPKIDQATHSDVLNLNRAESKAYRMSCKLFNVLGPKTERELRRAVRK
jgi:hypothetical protein